MPAKEAHDADAIPGQFAEAAVVPIRSLIVIAHENIQRTLCWQSQSRRGIVRLTYARERSMSAGAEAIRQMLASLSTDARHGIEKAINGTKARFSASGRGRSSSMSRAIDESVAQVVRETANLMATKARAYAGGTDVSDLVEAELKRLIEGTLTDHFSDGWDSGLKTELERLRDAAVMDLRHMPASMAIGMHVQVTDNQGTVAISGHGGIVNQSIRGTSAHEVAALLRDLSETVSVSTLPREQQLELRDDIEVIEMETTKQAPDEGKVKRYLKRIGETAEKAGIAAVGPVVTALLKHFGE